jgi:hypothetical protein
VTGRIVLETDRRLAIDDGHLVLGIVIDGDLVCRVRQRPELMIELEGVIVFVGRE